MCVCVCVCERERERERERESERKRERERAREKISRSINMWAGQADSLSQLNNSIRLCTQSKTLRLYILGAEREDLHPRNVHTVLDICIQKSALSYLLDWELF